MKNTKNAFTLVELIVVITILAILGTIAFISLQGYSAEARNSKRISDLGNVQSAMSLKGVEGVPLLSFIIAKSANRDANLALAGVSTQSNANYEAGTPNYTVLNVVKKDFLDPKGDNEYRIAASTEAGGVFEVAATLELDGEDTAKLNGTFSSRTGSSMTGTSDNSTFTLDDAHANFFKIGDSVENQTSSGFIIDNISRDGVTLTLDGVVTGSTHLNLVTAEDDGLLIGSNEGNTLSGTVSDAGTTYLPY